MAKNFPYFKFIATEWLTGDIVYEDFDVQGLFINICALYWQRDGKLSIEDITKRYKNETLIQSLSGRYFSVNDGFITISFLDEQLIDANHISKTNSENGKKGAEKRRQLAMAKRSLSERSANFSKEKKNKRKEEEKQSIGSEKELILKFTSWFNEMYLKHQSKQTKYRTMTKTDINNLKKLKEVYDAKDFDKAFRNMLVNPWVVENNKGTIDHFLRNDNFVKYLNTETIEETKTKFKAAWQ